LVAAARKRAARRPHGVSHRGTRRQARIARKYCHLAAANAETAVHVRRFDAVADRLCVSHRKTTGTAPDRLATRYRIG